MFCGVSWIGIGILLEQVGVHLTSPYLVGSGCLVMGGLQWWLGGEIQESEKNERKE